MTVDEETLPTFEYIVRKLDKIGVAYLHIMEPFNTLDGLPVPPMSSVAAHFRALFPGTLISSTDHTRPSGNRYLDAGVADLIAFGRAFIGNPDLVERFASGARLNVADRDTYYTGGQRGYTDYPELSRTYNGMTVGTDDPVGTSYGSTRGQMQTSSS